MKLHTLDVNHLNRVNHLFKYPNCLFSFVLSVSSRYLHSFILHEIPVFTITCQLITGTNNKHIKQEFRHLPSYWQFCQK